MMVSPGPHDYMNSEKNVYENRAELISSPFRADDLSDISFAAEATDDYDPDYSHRRDYNGILKIVEVEKTQNGFGFNIVGGVDNPHFFDDVGFFISSVKEASKAFGLVQTGDKILMLDGIDMTQKTHDEAVEVFRNIEVGRVAKMLIERNEALLEERTQTPSNLTSSFTSFRDSPKQAMPVRRVNGSPMPESRGRMTPHGVATVVERLRAKNGMDDEDAQSVTSYAPSTHSIIDDVPRTPRKPMSLLDPRNNSLFTECLYVSIGLGVLTLTGFGIYRFLKGRK